MPRILHTSDWHLGAPFHGVDRGADEQTAIDAIVRICAQQAVDAVLITGDIFDTANPGSAECRRWYEALLRLVREGGVGSVVVIAGNHDSGARLDGPRGLLAACQVSVRGSLALDAPAADCLLPVLGRDGVAFALCAAVPYLRETELHMPAGDEAIAARQARAMQERCAGILAHARERAAAAGLPLVAAAHAYVRGGLNDRSERPVLGEATTIGKLGQIDAAILGEGAAYLALGHLHRPQRVAGQEHWRYSGSLLPTGFDELGCRRSVVLATLDGDAPAAVALVDLPAFRRYATVQGTLEEVRHAIDLLPAATPGEPTPLLMATVRLSGERHGVSAEVAAWAGVRGWSALRVQRESVIAADAAAYADGPAIAELTPLDVFRSAHRARHGGNEPSPDLASAFSTLLADEQAGREA